MVYNYKGKLGQGDILHTPQTLEKALSDIQNGRSINHVSAVYIIPKGTLSYKAIRDCIQRKLVTQQFSVLLKKKAW